MGYQYYDSPDGQDCGKKLLYMLKKGGLVGLFGSTAYVILGEKPSGYVPTLARFARITLPCLAVAGAGAISVCLLADSRKKDDKLNHAIGGFIGGLAGGLAKGHFGHGLAAGCFFAVLAAGIKEAHMNNMSFVLDEANAPATNYDDHWTKDYNWILAKKRQPDWIAK